MKAGWKTVKLGDILKVQNGYAFDSKFFGTGGMPLIRIRDIKHGTTTETSYSGDYDEAYVVHSGDYLIGMDGEFRCYMWRGPAALLNQRVCRLTNFSPNALPAFICYGINKYLKEIEDVTGYSTVKHLSSKSILSIQFPLPPLAEQKRIVALLDEAFAGIDAAKAKAEANLEDAIHLFRSHTQSIFTQNINGWPTKQLADICDFEGGSQPPKSKFIYSQKPGYVRFLQIRDFGSDKYVTFIPESKKNRHCGESDILIARYGASVGKILTGKSGAYNVALMKTLPDLTQLDLNFFHQYLTSGAFQDRLVKVAARSAQNGFSKEDIHAFPVPVPPLAEQRRVIHQLKPLSELCQTLSTTYGRKNAILADLKASLLAQAFAGELTA